MQISWMARGTRFKPPPRKLCWISRRQGPHLPCPSAKVFLLLKGALTPSCPSQPNALKARHAVSAGDEDRRYFEGPWMHKYNGKYYLSYSTGTTHYLVYAEGDRPDGPFTYKGRIMEPVIGWTTHHSIVEYRDKWYLFYHDCELSNGINHRRCVKFTELTIHEDGTIDTIRPYEV